MGCFGSKVEEIPYLLTFPTSPAEALASIQRLQQFLLIKEAPDSDKANEIEARFVSGAKRRPKV